MDERSNLLGIYADLKESMKRMEGMIINRQNMDCFVEMQATFLQLADELNEALAGEVVKEDIKKSLPDKLDTGQAIRNRQPHYTTNGRENAR